jgi:hypothetical protein
MTRTVSPSPEQLGELAENLHRLAKWCQEKDPNSTIWLHAIEAADALESAQAEIARLTTVSGDIAIEASELRKIIAALGYCTHDASLEFIRLIPDEVKAAATIAKGRMEAIDGILAEAERLVLDGHPSRALLRVEEARAALKDMA